VEIGRPRGFLVMSKRKASVCFRASPLTYPLPQSADSMIIVGGGPSGSIPATVVDVHSHDFAPSLGCRMPASIAPTCAHGANLYEDAQQVRRRPPGLLVEVFAIGSSRLAGRPIDAEPAPGPRSR
jgi:hypothetical protein